MNFCTNCGGRVGNEFFYCKYCGKPLRKKGDQSGSVKETEKDSKENDITLVEEKKEIQSDLEKANEYKKNGDYENAITYYSMFLSFHPDNCEAWENKGFVLSLLGKYKEAINCFDKALELNPQVPELVLLNKGNSLINLKKYKEAILCFNSALDKDPNISHAWYSKTIAYINLKMPDRALICCEKALEIEPDHAEALKLKEEISKKVKEKENS
ncbi:MAG: tetratricopeptide repeat protein [Promethearchaeota archaeon]